MLIVVPGCQNHLLMLGKSAFVGFVHEVAVSKRSSKLTVSLNWNPGRPSNHTPLDCPAGQRFEFSWS